ncbi:MAG: DUF3127 domain-containing protein [Chitinophagaceae bacterium]
MEITGRIIQKLDMQKGSSAKGEWKKQEFIIETNDKFPKKVCVSAWSEKVDDLSRYNINDTVKVSYNLESREYNGRWYTDVRSWKIESASGGGSAPVQTENYNQAPVIEDFGNSDTSDDLPF